MKQRYDILFRGRVQGVGFRYATCRVADGLPVTGWVRNEADGSVRCVVEGDGPDLDRFVETVQEAMAGYVQATEIQKGPASAQFDGFSIRY